MKYKVSNPIVFLKIFPTQTTPIHCVQSSVFLALSPSLPCSVIHQGWLLSFLRPYNMMYDDDYIGFDIDIDIDIDMQYL